ncbi:hypothetical protein [Oscillibacter ruminantium]|uniref:hypothetical protein n=1 Tax=Oscillibacter ruminantium TaxID=1263547 RepID=UPI00030E1F37|nr:hypothetical protein [Oscillibacter ruminantium]
MSCRVDLTAWNKMWDYWSDFIEEVPEAIKTALYAAAVAAQKEVLAQIDQRGVPGNTGRIKRWQEIRMGSGGHYSAVSPTFADVIQVAKSSGDWTTSADLTRYLDRGYGIRQPSGRAKRYRPRIRGNGIYVKGYQFYSWAAMKADKIALDAAETALREFDEELDDAMYGGKG